MKPNLPATTRTLIVGAGGFGRELYWWMQSHSSQNSANTFAGFLDDNQAALDGFSGYAPGIIDTISSYQPEPYDQLVMAINTPKTKLSLAKSLQTRGSIFATFVHKDALIVPNARIGYGSVVCPGAVLSCDSVIGDFVTMNVYASLGHDSQVGDGCTMSSHTDVMGKVQLGSGVFMGSHASVLPGISVGDFARIGANSVVIRRVLADTTVFGVPARKLDFANDTTAMTKSLSN